MTVLSRRLLLALPAALVPFGLPVPARAQDAALTAPIAALDAGLIQAMKSGRATPYAQRYAALAPAVQRAFDLQAVLQTAVGLRWAEIPPDQQGQLLAAFTRFTIATYLANFDSYSGQRFDLAGTRSLGAEQVVQTLLVSTGGSSTKLDYVMRQEAGGWRAVDVLLDGTISRAAVLRSDFRALLRGGSAAPLIQNLQQKADSLSAGSAH